MQPSTPGTTWAPILPLVTERLHLRAHRRTDLDDLLAFHGDPETTRYLPWPVRTRQQTEEALVPKLTQHVVSREGDWLVLAMEERSSGVVIGEVLLKREAGTRCELGFVIRRDREGLGLASEAARAMLDLAFNVFEQTTVEAQILRGNDASARMVTRLGFVRAPASDYAKDGVEVDVYVLQRMEIQ